jgi:hypothetical protein
VAKDTTATTPALPIPGMMDPMQLAGFGGFGDPFGMMMPFGLQGVYMCVCD